MVVREGSVPANDIRADIARESAKVLQKIKADSKLSHYVARDYTPSVFVEAEDLRNIRLVVIGQDPTVKREDSRGTINTVLNLDKPRGSLYRYVSEICDGLGLDLHQHIYATNYAKNFFVRPPTQIKECCLLDEFGLYWLPLLHKELSLFPGRPILTLGQPLLQTLVIGLPEAMVRWYWRYEPNWKESRKTNFLCVAPEDNKLGRRLFPFPHQPSLRKPFYRATLQSYLDYMKTYVS
jgi:uracil-DNA glycosylase